MLQKTVLLSLFLKTKSRLQHNRKELTESICWEYFGRPRDKEKRQWSWG